MNQSVILRIDRLTVALLKSNPPQLSITVQGTVPTPGWSQPELVPYVYVMPPIDGILDFDFIAKPPTNVVSQVLTPIAFTHIEKNPPSWVRGVRVHASLNSKEALIGEVPDSGQVFVKGALTNEGVECQVLRTESGELYSLAGEVKEKGFKVGDTVYVLGTIVPISFCMQGTTIAIIWISKEPSLCRA
jgi:hypothetical protein